MAKIAIRETFSSDRPPIFFAECCPVDSEIIPKKYEIFRILMFKIPYIFFRSITGIKLKNSICCTYLYIYKIAFVSWYLYPLLWLTVIFWPLCHFGLWTFGQLSSFNFVSFGLMLRYCCLSFYNIQKERSQKSNWIEK